MNSSPFFSFLVATLVLNDWGLLMAESLSMPQFYISVLIVVILAYLAVLIGVWIYRKILKPIWKDTIRGNRDYRFWRAAGD